MISVFHHSKQTAPVLYFEYCTRKVKALQEDLTSRILCEYPCGPALDYRGKLSVARVRASIIGIWVRRFKDGDITACSYLFIGNLPFHGRAMDHRKTAARCCDAMGML